MVGKKLLATFPDFTTLDSQHQATIEGLLKGHQPFSDYNFISLWSWDHQNKLRLCQLNGNLAVRFQDYNNPKDFFYSFFGTNKTDQTARDLLEFSLKEGKSKLRLIAQTVIDSLKRPSRFSIQEDRDSFDYIVAAKNTADLAKLEASKRRSIKKFLKTNQGKVALKELDIGNRKSIKELSSVVEKWRRQSLSRDTYSESEMRALKRMLGSSGHINTSRLHVVGLYVGGDLSAFSINELLDNGFAMGHYKKADLSYEGLPASLDHFTAASLLKKGVSQVNHEQDLGLKGLRTSKLSAKPAYFLKKYTIKLK